MTGSVVKKIRHTCSHISHAVHGVSNVSDIATLFAQNYEDFYTSVAYNPVDIKHTSQELSTSLKFSGYADACTVNMSNILGAIGKLKPPKLTGMGFLLQITLNMLILSCLYI